MEAVCLEPQSAAIPVPITEPSRLLRVGCALLPKKVSRYLTPQMKAFALSQGLELTLVDVQRPLDEQGPFDAIIHKLRPNPDWERNLLGYMQRHPHVTVIDRVDCIRTLQNRSTMLSPLHGDGVLLQQQQEPGEPAVRVQAPHQVVIPEGATSAEAAALLASAGLQPPLLVKPLWTDGREGSHGLAVLHEMHTLDRLLSGQVSSDLQPPLVVQQFVEHGGVLFKVYVIGERTVVSIRPSLGDKHLGHAAREGVLALPRISCKSATDLRRHDSEADDSVMHLGPGSGGRRASISSTGGRPSVDRLTGAATSAGLQTPPAGLPRTPTPLHSSGIRSSSTGGALSSGPLQAKDGLLVGQEHVSGSGGLAMCGGSDSGDVSCCTQPPPPWATHALATVLRQRLGLELFNFDLICPSGTQQQRMQHRLSQASMEGGSAPQLSAADTVEVAAAAAAAAQQQQQAGHAGNGNAHGSGYGGGGGAGVGHSDEWLYYVVDVNYFPGVDKIPNFEAIFVDFLKDACSGWGRLGDARGESGGRPEGAAAATTVPAAAAMHAHTPACASQAAAAVATDKLQQNGHTV